VALTNVRNKKKFILLAGQLYPEGCIGVYNGYMDATQEPHGIIHLDLTQSTNDGLRFRTNIFPNDIPLIAVYSDVGDEAGENELSHSVGAKDGRT